MILYEVNCKFPLSRKITLKRSDAFEIRAHYANPVPYMDQEIGKDFFITLTVGSYVTLFLR